jgi:hypothetical protein
MRPFSTSAISIAAFCTLVLACGGSVVFVEDGGEGGQGAQGASGPGTTKAAQSTSPSGPVTATATTSSGVTNVSVTTGSMTCDTGVPGSLDSEECFVCQECSINTTCSNQASACGMNQDCLDFADCFGGCFGSPGCQQMCQGQHPQGAPLYLALFDCVLCFDCPINCDSASLCSDG